MEGGAGRGWQEEREEEGSGEANFFNLLEILFSNV
jgi:hypothetical protein